MDNFEIEKIPRWLHKTTDCLFCGKDMDLYCIREIEDAVQGWYACNNEKCEYLKRFNKQSTQGINYTGGFPEAYKKHLQKEREEAAKKPEEREVEFSTEIKEQDKT